MVDYLKNKEYDSIVYQYYWNGDKVICVVDGFTIWEMKMSGLSIQLRNSENVHLNKFKKEQEEENKNESRGK